MKWFALVVLMMSACNRKAPMANPEFTDAIIYTFANFEADAVDMAYAMRTLERETYLGMDVEASSPIDRALSPAPLTEADIEGLEGPDRDIADALPIAVAGLSAFSPAHHQLIQLLDDQTPVEPYSPDVYDRTFLEGRDCWQDQGCLWLRTDNDLIKDNTVMTVPYAFYKDFRWVDLALPDPADVPDGEEAVNEGEPRWAFIARSWIVERGIGEGGDTSIDQGYTVEMWIPRDGDGYIRSAGDANVDGGDWTADSSGGGVLHLLSLWSESEIGIDLSDDLIIKTARGGIDDNFKAAEAWLEENI